MIDHVIRRSPRHTNSTTFPFFLSATGAVLSRIRISFFTLTGTTVALPSTTISRKKIASNVKSVHVDDKFSVFSTEILARMRSAPSMILVQLIIMMVLYRLEHILTFRMELERSEALKYYCNVYFWRLTALDRL